MWLFRGTARDGGGYAGVGHTDCALEDGEGKIRLDTDLPFGYGFRLSDLKKLCAAADRFGCSVDFLLGWTDVPQGRTSLEELRPKGNED